MNVFSLALTLLFCSFGKNGNVDFVFFYRFDVSDQPLINIIIITITFIVIVIIIILLLLLFFQCYKTTLKLMSIYSVKLKVF